jgi:hypothetical protein
LKFGVVVADETAKASGSEVQVALQGTLETFALADVLRLLASTKKSGVLRIDGDRGQGELTVADGELVAAAASGAPRAERPAEVLFELLRYGDGSFVFDTDVSVSGTYQDNVDEALADAEEQLREWREIEAVIPSPTRLLRLVSERDREITLTARQWAAVVAIGSGRTSLELGERLGLTELPATRLARDLVELGAVVVGAETHTATPAIPEPEPEPDPFPEPEPEAQVQAEPELVVEPAEAPEPPPVPAPPTAQVIDLHRDESPPPPPPPAAPPSEHGSTGMSFADPPASPSTASFAAAPSFIAEPPPPPAAPPAPAAFAPASDTPPAFAPEPVDVWNDDPDDQLSSFHDDPEPAGSGLFGEAPGGPGPDDPFGPDPFHIPTFSANPAADAREAEEAAEMARQLANLSPRAQQAVAAAAAASTDEEREQAIARVENDSDGPINRNLLLKYLSSVDE